MCRIKALELFAIDGDGWLSTVNTLTEDTYTMAVVAHDGDASDTALVVVHVTDVIPASASTHYNRDMLVAIAAVFGALLLVALVVVTCLILRCNR